MRKSVHFALLMLQLIVVPATVHAADSAPPDLATIARKIGSLEGDAAAERRLVTTRFANSNNNWPQSRPTVRTSPNARGN
jgi:hypothetical protein